MNKLWLITGISLPIIILVIFSLGGIFEAITENGKCFVPPCSAGSGSCGESLSSCFGIHNNPLSIILFLPTLILVFPLSFLIENFTINTSIYISTSFILYFLIGALIGFLIQKRYMK
jgi:hypothetical protein